MDTDSPTITLNETGATPPRAASASPGVIIDAKGRKLTLRELTLLEEQDLLGVMPKDHIETSLTLGRALMAARVATIDGEPCEVPITKLQYRSMLQQVGKEGLAAVIEATLPITAAADEIEAAKN